MDQASHTNIFVSDFKQPRIDAAMGLTGCITSTWVSSGLLGWVWMSNHLPIPAREMTKIHCSRSGETQTMKTSTKENDLSPVPCGLCNEAEAQDHGYCCLKPNPEPADHLGVQQ